jgi:hypothetical protein
MFESTDPAIVATKSEHSQSGSDSAEFYKKNYELTWLCYWVHLAVYPIL